VPPSWFSRLQRHYRQPRQLAPGVSGLMCVPSPRDSILGVLLFAILATPFAHGQRRSATPDERIVEEAQRVASGARVDLFQHGLVADPALVGVAERALARMEDLLGRRLDESTLGARIRIYVAAGTVVSHVWRGYEHPSDPKAIVFLTSSVAQLALTGANATYAHELAHLLTWRYYSHTLREGLADYLALQIHPGAAVGPNSAGYALPSPMPPEVEQYLGTTRAPPAAVRGEIQFRRAYYFASYRFVRFLIERRGMAAFLEIYGANEPEREYLRLYGATREELVAAAAR